MPRDKKLKVILCWHMHQPEYRRLSSGDFALPWTYLHALKDYADMAWHLENQPGAKAVFNFVPVLLDQLSDYGRQFDTGIFRDPLLAALALPDLKVLGPAEREHILHSCFRANFEHMVNPFPAYRRLHDFYRMVTEDGKNHLQYLSNQYFADLLVWYHLAWTGESVRRSYDEVARLLAKGSQFTPADRHTLLRVLGEVIKSIIPRYRQLAEQERIELSSTPYYHPILPLLQDFGAARESLDAPLPQAPRYPGGDARAAWHIEAALASHQDYFGRSPVGMWPAEGGVSDATLALLAKHRLRWAATGEGVLANSLRAAGNDPLPSRHEYLYHPYRIQAGEQSIVCFFRDDRLSDQIGFEYAKWFGRDAVSHFVGALEDIWRYTRQQDDPVVSIILDGENAWEHYPYNGYYFLSDLYKTLVEHPHLELSTFAEYLAGGPDPAALPSLSHVVAGSWVYGTFSTWIGSPEKNRAWDLLCAAKDAFDHASATGLIGPADLTPALHQLAICEGSDWFWWFGDYNPADTVHDFDALYREDLSNLYRLLKLQPPEALRHAISTGQGHPAAGGTMRRASDS